MGRHLRPVLDGLAVRDLHHRFWADGRDRRKVGRRAVRRSYEVTVPSLHRTSPR